MKEEQRKKRRLYFAAVILITAAAHGPALMIPYHFDDYHHVVENPAVKSLSHLPRFFVNPALFSGQPAGEGMYRPLLMISHALTYALFGPSPAAAHLVNIVLHLVNVWLVMGLALILARGDLRISALAGLLFGVAAVQFEAVAYVSARSTLLASLFMLLAARAWVRNPPGVKRGAWAGLFFLFALLCKESAFSFPLLAAALDLIEDRFRGDEFRRGFPGHLVLWALAGFYLGFRFLLFNEPFGYPLMSRAEYLLLQARVFFWYLWKTATPAHLSLLPFFQLQGSLFSPRVLLAPICLILLVGFALFSLKKTRLPAFGLFWFGFSLLPTSSLVPLMRTAALERIYLGLFGIFFALFSGGVKVLGRGRTAGAALAAVLLSASLNVALTVQNHLRWRDPVAVMKQAVKSSPESSLAWLWLGLEEMRKGRGLFTREHLLKAIKLDPLNPKADQALASYYAQKENPAAARRIYERIAADRTLAPSERANALMKLAAIELDRGLIQSAEKKALKALELVPDNVDALYILGRAAEAMGEKEKARGFYEKALRLLPEYSPAESRLGALAAGEGNLGEAMTRLSRLVERGNAGPEDLALLGHLWWARGEEEKALSLFNRAAEKFPDNPLGFMALGQFDFNKGRLESALENLSLALEKDPDFQEAALLYVRVCLRLAESSQGSLRDQLLARAGSVMKRLGKNALPQELVKDWERLSGEELR